MQHVAAGNVRRYLTAPRPFSLATALCATALCLSVKTTPQWSAIEKVSVRYTSVTKQDMEALESTFEGTKIV